MKPLRIFIFDEEPRPAVGERVKRVLSQHLTCASELSSSLNSLIHDATSPIPDLIIPIIKSFDQNLEKLFTTLQDKCGNTPILPIVDLTKIQHTRANLLLQSHDFVTIPLNEFELLTRIQRLITGKRARDLKKPMHLDSQFFGLDQLLGEASTFLAVKRRIPLIARSEATVLLTGETGTGKELFARTLHYVSRRAAKPFLPVNCGAIPIELFERELFGHQKGAYTSAWAAQPGLIEEAEGGTLFLDEIETLSLAAQVKLLRFLQDETYHTLGSSKLRQADVWIIASTNADLNNRVRAGTFREDLFYRLAVMTLTLPPLRARRADIPLLAVHFLNRYTEKEQRRLQFSPIAMEVLRKYSWPGNVRELENSIRQAVAFNETNMIQVDDLPTKLSVLSNASKIDSFMQLKKRVIQEFEKTYIAELLDLHDGNVTHAALAARKERRAFGRLVKKYNLKRHSSHDQTG